MSQIIFKRKLTKVNSSGILKVNIPREISVYFNAQAGDILKFIADTDGIKIEVENGDK